MACRLLEEFDAIDDGAAFLVQGAEHKPADAGVTDSAGAHGAGLERHVEREAGEPVVADLLGRGA